MGARVREGSWPPDPEPLPVPVVDNHTHLEAVLAETDDTGWRVRPAGVARAGEAGGGALPAQDVGAHLARAAAVGVTRVIQIGCDLPAARWTDAAVRAHPGMLGGVAIHPNDAVLHAGIREIAPDGLEPRPAEHHATPLDEAIAQIAAIAAANDRIRAIGETGLDHFRAGERGRAAQRAAFRAHIALAKELDLVLQIHDRDAHDDVLAILAADGAPERTVLHCFSGDAAMAGHCVEAGWFCSFAGSVTFGSAGGLRAALRVVPLDRLLLESDGPYLAPHPHRGRPNGPYLVATTVRAVAAELGVEVAGLCAATNRTAERIYGQW
jgi:TatD DNase family protein